MIRGVVNAQGRAVARFRLRGPGGELDVDAVIDTGFTAALALPAAVIAALGLPWDSHGNARLADGSLSGFEIYAAEILWDDAWWPVLVSALGTKTLLGMRLLTGHELRVEVTPGGPVEITPLS